MPKRIIVLILSFTTIIAYGYALGALWGYMLGAGKPLVIAAGGVGGTLCAFAALRIWRSYLDDIEREDAEKKAAEDAGEK